MIFDIILVLLFFLVCFILIYIILDDNASIKWIYLLGSILIFGLIISHLSQSK